MAWISLCGEKQADLSSVLCAHHVCVLSKCRLPAHQTGCSSSCARQRSSNTLHPLAPWRRRRPRAKKGEALDKSGHICVLLLQHCKALRCFCSSRTSTHRHPRQPAAATHMQGSSCARRPKPPAVCSAGVCSRAEHVNLLMPHCCTLRCCCNLLRAVSWTHVCVLPPCAAAGVVAGAMRVMRMMRMLSCCRMRRTTAATRYLPAQQHSTAHTDVSMVQTHVQL